MTRSVVIVLALCMAAPAMAHSWYTGQLNENNQSCCGGEDCGPVPMDRVTLNPAGGYDVTLYAGDVPTLTVEDRQYISGVGGSYITHGIGPGPVVFHFDGNPGLSPDDSAHVCVVDGDIPERNIRCLFVGGSS